MRRRFLVTGGAGFVGSHVVAALLERGDDVVVLDDLSSGHREAVLPPARLVVANLADTSTLHAVLADGKWDGVLHFAALSLVGESMREPYRYLRDNVANGIRLIEACVTHGVTRFILSSTANLFGDNPKPHIVEDAPIQPASPYGESKWIVERILLWADRIHGLRSACLRYFNAAGADAAGRLGEDHDPETHLIPLTIDALLGRGPPLTVFGTDYPTEDGTCVRDYIHVEDLASAHLRALDRLDGGSVTYNIGSGRGYSVREIITAVEHVTGSRVPVTMGARRQGDPAILVAASDRLRAETGWLPRYRRLEDIVMTTFAWRESHPHGYDDRLCGTNVEALRWAPRVVRPLPLPGPERRQPVGIAPQEGC